MEFIVSVTLLEVSVWLVIDPWLKFGTTGTALEDWDSPCRIPRKHVTALHAGPPSKPAAEEVELKDAHQYGGEPAVTSSCTKVCRNTMGGKSCAKMSCEHLRKQST